MHTIRSQSPPACKRISVFPTPAALAGKRGSHRETARLFGPAEAISFSKSKLPGAIETVRCLRTHRSNTRCHLPCWHSQSTNLDFRCRAAEFGLRSPHGLRCAGEG
jgi:hypothetical protein